MPPIRPCSSSPAGLLPSRLPARRLGLLAAVSLLLSACAAPLPPVRWVRLPAEAAEVGAAVPQPATASHEVWQLVAPVALPGHLDRDALLVAQGGAGLQPLAGVRWAEPLRDAVPRLLRGDLARALGAPLWSAPLPPGVRPTRQLRLELLAFDVQPDGRSVALQARWSVADPAGAAAPRVGETALVVPAAGPQAEALVAAHRQALAQLAQRLAAHVLRAD